jgi:phosphate transport system protein
VARSLAAHSSRDFETELRELRAHLQAMGARCERFVALACSAFLQGTQKAATELQELDAQIDGDEIQIHALILRILALRQPVADDLRFLATALRLIVDLERIGDEAVNIAERTVDDDARTKALVSADLAVLSASACDMLHGALESLVLSDEESAEHVLGCDDAVDQGCAAIIAAMTAHMSRHPNEVRAGLRVIGVAKYLERIADHATNVAEEVIFMLRGEDVRHGWVFRSREDAGAPNLPAGVAPKPSLVAAS